jgi:hypothetical protein
MTLASLGLIIVCKNRSSGKFTWADPIPAPGTSTRCEVAAWLEVGAMVIQIPGNEHFVREPFHRWHSRVLIEALITFLSIPQTIETVGPHRKPRISHGPPEAYSALATPPPGLAGYAPSPHPGGRPIAPLSTSGF